VKYSAKKIKMISCCRPNPNDHPTNQTNRRHSQPKPLPTQTKNQIRRIVSDQKPLNFRFKNLTQSFIENTDANVTLRNRSNSDPRNIKLTPEPMKAGTFARAHIPNKKDTRIFSRQLDHRSNSQIIKKRENPLMKQFSTETVLTKNEEISTQAYTGSAIL
jgi:hypothetical protein